MFRYGFSSSDFGSDYSSESSEGFILEIDPKSIRRSDSDSDPDSEELLARLDALASTEGDNRDSYLGNSWGNNHDATPRDEAQGDQAEQDSQVRHDRAPRESNFLASYQESLRENVGLQGEEQEQAPAYTARLKTRLTARLDSSGRTRPSWWWANTQASNQANKGSGWLG